MIWTGWNNGKWHSTGAGYSFKINRVERDRNFSHEWQRVAIELPTPSGTITVDVDVVKHSFWGDCRELISEDIGRWMLDLGYAPWAKGRPPKFEVAPSGDRAFQLIGPAPSP